VSPDVAFPIDVSKPFRYPSELRRLVDAVRNADENNETRWIEWKSTLDLTNPNWIRHLAKQILGFANREPRVATSWAGGHAYLIVGASPGELKGVNPIDPERLTSQIQPYVGSDINWNPEYIAIDCTQVLILIVEPPRPGDPIHVLYKDLESYKAGAVFIRRPGQTGQANAEEMAMLQRRLLERGSNIEIDLKAVNSTIETQPHFDSRISDWIREEMSRLNGFPAIERAKYSDEARIAQRNRALWHYYRHIQASLSLTLTNNCDRNFSQVGVQLTMGDGPVDIYDSKVLKLVDDDEPELPDLPKEMDAGIAQPSITALLTSPYSPPPLNTPHAPPPFNFPNYQHREWAAHKVDGQIFVYFDPVDVRPYYKIELPPLPLVVNTKPSSVISIDWIATATNVNGMSRGSVALTVTDSTFDYDWMQSPL
jgi:hypothetical protein